MKIDKVDSVLKQLMQELKVEAPLEEFKKGILVEREHTLVGPKKGMYSVIPLKLESLAKIAAAHLAELPDYYTRLAEMEKEGNSKTAAKPRKVLLDLMGLNSVNKVLDWWDSHFEHQPSKTEPNKKQKPAEEEEEIDDDFFASQEAEEAIYPTDIIQKPKSPNVVKKSTEAAKNPQVQSIQQIVRLQEQMHETLHYVVNKLIPEAKGNPEKFNSLRELRDNLETSLLTVEETLEKLK